MTTRAQAREAIYQRLVDNYSATPFTFQGEAYDPPATPWARLSVQINNGGGQDTLGPVGGRKYRREGLIAAQVFTPINTGLARGDELAQEIAGLYEGARFGSGIIGGDALVRESAPDDEWQMHIAEIFFDYEETR